MAVRIGNRDGKACIVPVRRASAVWRCMCGPCGAAGALLSFGPSLNTTADSSFYGSFTEVCPKGTKQKEVDEHCETLHNLASLLLTNKTIRRMRQGSTEYDL
ncbi:hypothetical protein AB4Z32_07915 [Massilia sp. 2TAF26]|uniref:hypothetical protein n=1 Tax=Massilia sp. 2TAF26 TaxID=3233012 RepID=UPI003F977DD6